MEYYRELAISADADTKFDALQRQTFLRLSQLCIRKCWTFEGETQTPREQQCLESCQKALFQRDLPLYYRYLGQASSLANRSA